MPLTLLTRRDTLGVIAAGFASVTFGGAVVRLAHAATDRRLILVVLRGALDGLAAVPPYFDRDYQRQRGALALAEPGSGDGALDLDGRFGLHPALKPLHAMWQARELAVVHAVATPYRSRSHFDGQDLLENGTARPRGTSDGWLNRALGVLGGVERRLGLAVGQTVPLVLRGTVPVGSWAPSTIPEPDPDFLARLAAIYRHDAVFAPAIAEGLRAQKMSDEVLGAEKRMGGIVRGPDAFRAAAGAVGRLLAAADGPRIAVLEAGGWDTHAGQGVLTGRLAAAMRTLADSLDALKGSLGPSWQQTIIAVVTEFGRTVAMNGTGGTDHGIATVALVLGGRANGGRVMTEWPGLSSSRLFEGRDLAPTTDLRAVLKGLLADHLSMPADAIERVVFPDSRSIAPLRDLVKA